MNLSCVGISHHTAPLQVRERLWFSDDEIRQTLPELLQAGYEEAVLFSTCNRTELYVLSAEDPQESLTFKEFLIRRKHAEEAVQSSDLFFIRGEEAAQHLFRVASGIDSMVLGDIQILMQVKNGFQLAVEQQSVGAFMNRLFQTALHAGKRSRAETAIGEGSVSVGSTAVELAERIFDDLSKKSALMIGAGETAELTALLLHSKKIGKLVIANRTAEHAEQLARKVQAVAVPYEHRYAALAESDIVLSSVDAPQFVLTKSDVLVSYRTRGIRPLFLIDLGVPRNIDPAVNDLDNVFLYDLDTLQGLVNETLQRRSAEIPRVESIVNETLHELSQWHSSLQVSPTISALSQFMENIRQEEVAKHINRFEAEHRELVEILTKRIINKILHTPITKLKQGNGESLSQRLQQLETLRHLFGLPHSEKPTDEP